MSGSRKQIKRKKRSCPTCHPHKCGWGCRWENKERADRLRYGRFLREHLTNTPMVAVRDVLGLDGFDRVICEESVDNDTMYLS